MTGRYTAIDIRDTIITLLQGATGFNYYIGVINTERTHVTPTASVITYKWGQNQFPFILVDIQGSEIQYGENSTPMSLDYKTLPEVFTVLIVGFLKYSDDRISDWSEDWIEAIIRSLHNYNSASISWIALTKTERVDLYEKENQTFKVFNCEFEVRIN